MSVILEGQPSDNSVNLQALPADYGFLKSLDLELIVGRDFTPDEKNSVIGKNESVDIPIGATHRLKNPGDEMLELIEVQSGSYLGEDDIERLEDYYGRQ